MLVGFTQPSHGTATIEGFDITKDMDRIYTLMGVCPQHDILWENLTARQHMLFYGRLKNLKGSELNDAVVDCLKQVYMCLWRVSYMCMSTLYIDKNVEGIN